MFLDSRLEEKIFRTKLPILSNDSKAQAQICGLEVMWYNLIYRTEIIYINTSLKNMQLSSR